MKATTASKSVAYLWALYVARESAPGYAQPYWNCRTPITREEIDCAIQSESFNEKGHTTSDRQGDRAWHIKQIAGLVHFLKNGGALKPIWLGLDDLPKDGCHRLYALWYLNRDSIEVAYENPDTAGQCRDGEDLR